MYRTILLAITLSSAVVASTCLAGSDAGEGHQVDAVQVQQWVAELDSGQFAVRQNASRKLREVGLIAVKPLAAAANGRQSEVTRRAVDILDSLCESDDVEVAEAARDALESLVHSAHRLPAQRASVVLRGQRLRQQRAALVEILRLGGTVTSAVVDDGELVIGLLVLGRKWEAGDEGLKYLVKLGRVEQLKLFGTQFTDEGLAHLTKLTGVQTLKLYSTEISEEGERHLQAALPGTLVDRRNGALLGVAGIGDARGCRLTTVREGSAAHRAGIEVDDVITAVNGVATPDMTTLISTIAKQQAGDRIKVALERGKQTLEKDIVLGELAEEMD
ncbi:MAG TPA: PDZ domain-containing protein [Pirellulales bacterium]|nr:PDZ domain-containing protein [Pirellulales bacterium]